MLSTVFHNVTNIQVGAGRLTPFLQTIFCMKKTTK